MQFFNFGDFPDSSIGGTVQEAFIPRGGAIDLRLSVFSQTATSEMRLYDVKRRLCFLFGENVDSEDENYSTDKCMTRCKAHGMLRLCGCVPYYIPSDFLGRSENNFTYCTLAHLECLYRNRVTLNTYSLLEHRTVSNRSLQCAHCLPLCNFNFYNFRRLTNLLRDVYQRPENVAFIKLIGRQGSDDKFNYTYDSLITLIKETEDLSIVKIYFDSLYAVLFSKRSLYTWYEILSNIGGVIGIFMGCSLVSAFEVIYFFIIKLINKMKKYY
uniref:Amiloride-sensitive cation channel 5 n=1 Tax=Zeugodacus cucurbitae TaxID=28588 RepID=A0A0A1XPJ6_ZEUCU